MIGMKNGQNIVNKQIKLHNRAYKLSSCLAKFILLLMLSCSQVLAAEGAADGNAYHQTIEDDDVETVEVPVQQACVDEKGKCLDDKKNRMVDNLPVARDCWKYEYIKNCNKVPSKNDCSKIPLEDFNLKEEKCLTTTKIGERSFCLNMKKTFSRTTQTTEEFDRSEIIMDPDNKEVIKDLLCEAFCLDGNCKEAHKANQGSNNEIANAVAQLEMLSNVKKGLIDENTLKFDIFSATLRRCHNKTGVYSNCCDDSGWLKSVGVVKCKPEDKVLATEGRKGRCEYVGEYCAKKILKKCIRKTKSYCCFPTVLAKVIHRGARNQLGKNLGSPQHPKCGGLTLDDIEKIDFSQVDFQEFFDREVQPMMKGYTSDDNEALIKRSFPSGSQNIDPNSFQNISKDGVNEKLYKNSETEER